MESNNLRLRGSELAFLLFLEKLYHLSESYVKRKKLAGRRELFITVFIIINLLTILLNTVKITMLSNWRMAWENQKQI